MTPDVLENHFWNVLSLEDALSAVTADDRRGTWTCHRTISLDTRISRCTVIETLKRHTKFHSSIRLRNECNLNLASGAVLEGRGVGGEGVRMHVRGNLNLVKSHEMSRKMSEECLLPFALNHKKGKYHFPAVSPSEGWWGGGEGFEHRLQFRLLGGCGSRVTTTGWDMGL
ncbi:hypothetical protein CEXT_205771 [Caerostris extrusa]|uniref:Uncharacterized protein n=1 Tax=Caerostris extrusa TaxID=172846 RepID=A0AAV4WP09_CAEEX|nr:hypothetical protein CEXT_205771 [Caerostris extrusa]